jgi:hypothetical protein
LFGDFSIYFYYYNNKTTDKIQAYYNKTTYNINTRQTLQIQLTNTVNTNNHNKYKQLNSNVMSRAGLGTKNECAGEDQLKFTRQRDKQTPILNFNAFPKMKRGSRLPAGGHASTLDFAFIKLR